MVRPAWLLGVAGGLALTSAPALCAPPQDSPTLIASAKVAVVGTGSGKVQGFVRQGVYSFRGIPYARAERFMPPQPMPPWPETRLALSYGNICPQPVSPELREPQTFISDTRFWPASEQCQNLNIWSPGVTGEKKRPVMVWLHGGGFFSGSSNELPVYDGTNLARRGDVVVVSLNHRLNVLGFLSLSAYGPVYKGSANVGMLDIVAALRWVHDNIAAFGGDPNNVTIFGQSGGGAKVAALMASPLAKGLFAKAIIQSGAPGTPESSALDLKTSQHVAELTLQFAGLNPDQADRLRTLPYEALVAASEKALRAVSDEKNKGSGLLGFPSVNWSPVIDGEFLMDAPFGNTAPIASKGVPLLVGSTLSEFQNLPDPRLRGRENWGESEFLAYLKGQFGSRAEALLAAYRSAYPDLKPSLWPLIDTRMRSGVLHTAGLKAAQGDAVYTYLFAWRSPVLDYAWAAGHSSEIGLVFDNPDAEEQALGGGPTVNRLAREMSTAWINFARTGKPGGDDLPAWPMYTSAAPATMVFDERVDVRVGHDAQLVQLATMPPPK
jgi:para-nitrobenzyl esterase